MSSDSGEHPNKSGTPFSRNFIFDRNSVMDATLYLNGSPCYTIMTSKTGTRTDICNIPGQCIIATIKRKEVLPDTVKFTGSHDDNTVAIKKWLKPITLPDHVEPLTSLATSIGNYVWKTDGTHRLALYAQGDAQTPVAYMIRVRPPKPLVLTLNQGCEDIMGDILVSFIILEQKLRMKEKRRASAMFYGPVSSVMP